MPALSFSHWTQCPLNRKERDCGPPTGSTGVNFGVGLSCLQSLLLPLQPSIMSPHLVKYPAKPALLLRVTCLKQKAWCCVRWTPFPGLYHSTGAAPALQRSLCSAWHWHKTAFLFSERTEPNGEGSC